jgi:outer membrane protein OmpA-like peptidoglycan-associated protein
MNISKTACYLFVTGLLIPAGSYAQTATKPAAQNESTPAASATQTAENQSVETVPFEKGSSKLSMESESGIRKFIDTAKTHGKITEVKVAVWSDHETPLQAEKDLSKEDRRLAEERGEQIKKFLRKDLGIKDVKIYNMAHGTSKLAKLFNTEEAELRTAFSQKGNDEKLRAEVRLIRDHGKPSTAVLVVEHHKGRTS